MHRPCRALAFEDALFINPKKGKYLEKKISLDPWDFHKLVEIDPDVLKTRENVI